MSSIVSWAAGDSAPVNVSGANLEVVGSYIEENELDSKPGFLNLLVNKENDVLTIFPKHFPIDKEKLEDDSHLLFNVLMKAQNKKPASMIGQDATKKFQTDYPFDSCFRVYNYFSEFGPLFEDRRIVKPNQGGKINETFINNMHRAYSYSIDISTSVRRSAEYQGKR